MTKEKAVHDELDIVGRVVGNTGGPTVTVSLTDSYSVKRGAFVRLLHIEEKGTAPIWVLGKVVAFSRESFIYSSEVASSADSIEAVIEGETGERNTGQIELVGYREPETGEIRIPRRPINPGAKVYAVDSDYLGHFYDYNPSSSIQLGTLIGYEHGERSVPVFLDVNRMATEHVGILAMTGAGKSYTVGRICELLLTQHNASIIIFDPHGEYGKAIEGGKLRFGRTSGFGPGVEAELKQTAEKIRHMQRNGAGLRVFAPKTESSDSRYGSSYVPLSLRIDSLTIHELMSFLPEMTPAQRRVMHPALKYWKDKYDPPLYVLDLVDILLTDEGFRKLKEWKHLPEGERSQLRRVSASVIGTTLKQLVESANIFLRRGQPPLEIEELSGRLDSGKDSDRFGRIAIVDLSGLATPAMQAAVAIILNEVIKARIRVSGRIRPVFVVLEEGHIFSPSVGACVSSHVVRRIASEGRKFGIGICTVSQRPGKLHPDTLSQCNTLITMRIKNPDDQRFIRSSSDYFSESDLRELPALSTGEALVCGRAILTSIIAKVGRKTLLHGGESPDVCDVWKV